MPDTPASEQIGTTLGGKYLLTRLLGEGGMGRVFAAEHAVLGKEVAVKVLLPRLAGHEETGERFLREARAASAMDHPGIIKVMDADRDESGALYMVMELLEGESLAALLERRRRLGVGETVEIARELLDAVACAHDHQIVHRDLKPDNIFLTEDGRHGSRLRVLDFGISRVLGPDADALRLTLTGTILGTPFYMSPEQARGERDIDHRADLWAVGVVLYEMLSGARPYRGTSYNEVMLRIATEPIPPLEEAAPDTPAAMVAFVEGALAKDPAGRYGSAAEMAAALERAAAAELPAIGLEATMAAPTPPPTPDSVAATPSQLEAHAPTVTAEAPALQAPEPTDRVSRSEESSAPTLPAQAPSRVGGFWRRAAALLVDLIIFSLVVGSLVDVVIPDSELLDVDVTSEQDDGEAEKTSETAKVSVSRVNVTDEGLLVVGDNGGEIRIDDDGIHIRESDGEEIHFTAGNIHVGSTGSTTLKVSLWILYCTLFLTFFGATPGKMVLRLRVADGAEPRGRLPFITALIRSAFFIISAFALGMGCLWSLSNRDRKTWHDRIARTRVLHIPE